MWGDDVNGWTAAGTTMDANNGRPPSASAVVVAVVIGRAAAAAAAASSVGRSVVLTEVKSNSRTIIDVFGRSSSTAATHMSANGPDRHECFQQNVYKFVALGRGLRAPARQCS